MATSDVDKSGNYAQWLRVYRGPTLGWSMVQVKPPLNVTAAGTVTLGAGDSVALVNVAGLVTINLPSVRSWLQENANQPSNAYEGALWIKDWGANAAAFPITVHPFSGDKIDNFSMDYTIIQNNQLLRLYPVFDLTGWFAG